MNKLWKYSPLWLLTLPLTIIYALHCRVVYRAHSWRWVRGRFDCVAGRTGYMSGDHESLGVTRIWGRPWGLGIGGRLLCHDTAVRRDIEAHTGHEVTHTWQAELCSLAGLLYAGPLAYWVHWSLLWTCCAVFPVLYGLEFARRYRGGDWQDAYRASAFEKQAYKIQAAIRRDGAKEMWT